MHEIVCLALGTFAITRAVVHLDGPFNAFSGLRALPLKVVRCFHCLSFWVAAMLTVSAGGNAYNFASVWGLSVLFDGLYGYLKAYEAAVGDD